MRRAIERIRAGFDRMNEGTQKRRRVYGVLGRTEPDGSVTVRTAGDPRLAHVRVQGEQATTTAFHRGVVNLDTGGGQPIILWREDGQLYIEGYDTAYADEARITQVYARSDNSIPAVFDRFSSDTAGERTIIYLAHITSADMLDNFGAAIQLAIEDDAGVRHTIGFLSARRDGADDSGRLLFAPMNGGVPGPPLVVQPDGIVQMEAYGAGVAVFDANGVLSSDPSVGGATDVAAAIWGAPAKVTPVDADVVGLVDTEAANALKKLSWANIKATLETYFDTVYATIASLANYALLAGRAGGQTLRGGTGSGETLTLEGSSHATSGGVVVDDDLAVDGLAYFGGTPFTPLPFYIETIAGTFASVPVSGINTDRLARFQIGATASLDWLAGGAGVWIHAGIADTGFLAFSTRTGTGGSANRTRMRIANNGNVAIGPSAPATSAKLDIQGSDGALLLPRLTTAQKNALTSTNGMTLADTTLNTMEAYVGGAWRTAAHQNQTTKSVSGVGGTAVTLLPAGTVSNKLQASGVVVASNGTTTSFTTASLIANTDLEPGGANYFIYRDSAGSPTQVLELSVTGTGAIQVQRTAGTLTYSVTLTMIWL